MENNHSLKYITAFLALLLIFISVVLYQSTAPYRSAKKQAVSIAEDLGKISQVEDFYWFTRKDTSFSVTGKTSDGDEKIVMIPQDGQEALVIDAKKGYTREDVLQEIRDLKETRKITKISLGLFDEKPVWEVTAKNNANQLAYYLVDFYTGKIISKI